MPADREVPEPVGIAAEAIAYAGGLFAGDASGHDLAHSLRVRRNALLIAAEEPPCDLLVVELAAILHDVDDHKLFSTRDNAHARAFLAKAGVEAARTERICEVIGSVSFSKNRGRRPATPEGRIVQDADRLDALGAIGIARTFAYGGAHGRSLESSVQHFHDKLLLLAGEMNTACGQRLARSRHELMLRFLDELAHETGSVGGQP